MSQKCFQIIRPVHVHLKTDKVDFKKRPPWKKFFLHIFSIHSSSRTEKRCQMLQTLFLLFQCSKNPQCFFCSCLLDLLHKSPLNQTFCDLRKTEWVSWFACTLQSNYHGRSRFRCLGQNYLDCMIQCARQIPRLP